MTKSPPGNKVRFSGKQGGCNWFLIWIIHLWLHGNFHLRFITTLPNFDMTEQEHVNIYQTKKKSHFQMRSSYCGVLEVKLDSTFTTHKKKHKCVIIIKPCNIFWGWYKRKKWSWEKNNRTCQSTLTNMKITIADKWQWVTRVCKSTSNPGMFTHLISTDVLSSNQFTLKWSKLNFITVYISQKVSV